MLGTLSLEGKGGTARSLREGGREGRWEEGREGRREVRKEGGREASKQGRGKEAG